MYVDGKERKEKRRGERERERERDKRCGLPAKKIRLIFSRRGQSYVAQETQGFWV